MFAAIAALLVAAAAPSGSAGQISGRVLDAVSAQPVRLAVVTAVRGGQELRAVLTDDLGAFAFDELAAGPVVLAVQHPSHEPFSSSEVALVAGANLRVELKIPPSELEAEPVEIVDTKEEALRPMLVRQDKIDLGLDAFLRWRGGNASGLYRVCVARSGKVVLVAALEASPLGDRQIRDGIRTGWEYRPLPAPSCFNWRVQIIFPKPSLQDVRMRSGR